MFRIRKVWWAVTVLLISLYIPGKGHAVIVRTDQFKRTVLTGRAAFRYNTSKHRSESGGGVESAGFSQNYGLNMSGNILHQLLIIYETGINYSKENREYDASKLESDRIIYHLNTHFLPESNIPLSLHGKRIVAGDSRTNNYGLIWQGKFRRLPKTNVTVDKSTTKNRSTDRQSLDYGVTLNKKLRRSTNRFEYTLSEREDNVGLTESSTMAMNFINRTRISRSTNISFNAARGTSKSDDDKESSAEALSASFSSSPSDIFSQTHSYYYSQNKDETSHSTNEGYGGNITYGFSNRLRSTMSLRVSNDESDSLTSKREADLLATSGGLSYRASEKLSFSESIGYTTTNSLGSEAGQINLIDQSTFRLTTGVNYRTKLSWAMMNATYDLGYLEESRTGEISAAREERAKALEERFYLSLEGIDAKGYATINATGEYGHSEALEGDLNKRDYSLRTTAESTVWQRYVLMSASYNKKIIRSWISADERELDQLSFRAKTAYLTKYLNPKGNGRTTLSFTSSRSSASDNFDNQRNSTSRQIDMLHDRSLYRGGLTGSIHYDNTQSQFTGNGSNVSHLKFRAEYSRALLRRIGWKAVALSKTKTSEGSSNTTISIRNIFKYRLRVWSLSAEHQYRIRRQSRSRSTDTRIMLTASRSFVRVF